MAEDGAHHPPSVLVLPVLRVYGPQDNGGAGPPEPRIVNDSVGRVSAATSPVYEKMPLACPCKKETICDITFSKNESVTMEAHQTAVSDPVSFPVKKGMTLTVSLYFADFTLMQSAVLVTGPLSKGFFSCRILRLRRVASNGNSPFIAVQSCPAGLSSVLILLKYCIHQLLCIRLFRLIDNSIRLPALHHFSVIQNQHLIAEALYKCKIMADKYKG